MDSVSDPNAPTWSEIAVHGEIDTGGAITIDNDGYDGSAWESGAQVLLGANNIITGNEPDEHVFHVTSCLGDLNNDEVVNDDDWDLYELTDAAYDNAACGLLGSRRYHSDGNYDGEWYSSDEPNDVYDPNNDYPYIRSFTNVGEMDPNCCVAWDVTLPLLNTDIYYSGVIDLGDLGVLLGDYGCTSGCIGDTDGDGDTDLADLAELLGDYGDTCGCPDEIGLVGGSMQAAGTAVTVSVAAVDTGGYSGGGAHFEVDHFAFDLKIEVLDPNSDDWVATGAKLSTFNDATFRLSSSATTPDAYATFVAAPWTSVPGSATANLAGAYSPADPNEVFTTSAVNLGWYDGGTSNDGPATVMRIVIDVSEVDGADVSGGFGSVYFGLQRDQDDIKVTTLTASGTYTAGSAPNEESLSGDFWVTGE